MRRCHRCPFHLGENWNKTIQAKDASKPNEAQPMAATYKCADRCQLANRRNRGGGSAAYPFRHPSIRTAANEVGASQLKLTAGFVSHRRGIGRLFGNGICPPIGGSFALADACAFGARFRMASAALWKAATAWSSHDADQYSQVFANRAESSYRTRLEAIADWVQLAVAD